MAGMGSSGFQSLYRNQMRESDKLKKEKDALEEYNMELKEELKVLQKKLSNSIEKSDEVIF